MDIRTPSGGKVIFSHPEAGYVPDQRRAALFLKQDHVYTVQRTEIERYSTDVYLAEFPENPFNSCMFENVP